MERQGDGTGKNDAHFQEVVRFFQLQCILFFMMYFINEEKREFVFFMEGLNDLEQATSINSIQRDVAGGILKMSQKLFQNYGFPRTTRSDKANLVLAGVVENLLKHISFTLVRFSLRQGNFIQLEDC